jgi:hypothetical protein
VSDTETETEAGTGAEARPDTDSDDEDEGSTAAEDIDFPKTLLINLFCSANELFLDSYAD